ncbi:MAG: hypothetical protein ACM30G_03530 [Micromonosporaceae bacterium]
MYEQPYARRFGPMFFAAVAVLAIVAGTASYFGTRRILGVDPNLTGGGGHTTSPTPVPNPGGPGGPGTEEPTSSASPDTGPTGTDTSPTPDPAAGCPAVTATAVHDAGLPSELKLLLYVQLRRSGAAPAEAWVCKNSDGTLFYQGHMRGRPFELATSSSSILLGTGIKGEVATEGSGFVATNVEPDKRTEYHVSAEAFKLVLDPGGETVYEVVRAVQPQ